MKRMLGVAGALLAWVAVAQADDFSAWTKKMTLVFGGYSGTEALVNFPVLVKLPAAVTAQMLEGGADLRFADAQNNSLAYDVDTWNAEGDSFVWVRVPTLTRTTSITAYWGNENAAAPLDSTATWNNGFTGVWHMGEPDANGMADSAQHGMHGTRVNTTTAPGVAGGAQVYSGNEYVRVPDHRAMDLGDTFTVSGWFKYPETLPANAWRRYFSRKTAYNGDAGWEVEKEGSSHHIIRPRGNNAGNQDVAMPNGWTFASMPRQWFLITVQYKGENAGSVYVNGVKAGDTNLGNSTATDIAYDFCIGAGAWGGDMWVGEIDEVRLENAIRSEDWVKAAYDTVMTEHFTAYSPAQNNVADSSPLATMEARSVTWASAEIVGFAAAVQASVSGWLYWGTSDGFDDAAAWTQAPVPVTVSETGIFSVALNGLIPTQSYWARFCADDGSGELIWSAASVAFEMQPLPLPELGHVSFVFTPDATTANVPVTRLGVNTTLTFFWTPEGAAEQSMTRTPVVGDNTFTIPGLARGDVCTWRVLLDSDSGSNDASGTFTVTYIYNWIGPVNGAQVWNNPANWDLGLVPNSPGAVVIFPYGNPNIDIAGMGTLTLGTLTATVTDWSNFYISSSDGTPIVFDNAGAPASIKMQGSTWGNMILTAPQQFISETHVSTTTAEGRYYLGLFNSTTGTAPLVLDLGRVAFGATAGVTNRVELSFRAKNIAEQTQFFQVRGQGTVLFENRVDAFPLAGDWGGTPFVSEGSTLRISNSVVTNTSTVNLCSIFADNNNALFLEKGSRVIYARYSTFIRGSNNRIDVSDSTLMLSRILCNGVGNTLFVRDGGYMAMQDDSFSFRGLYWDAPGRDSLVRVASLDPARPGVLDLFGKDFHLNATNCVLSAQAGGIVTNIATLNLGIDGFANRIALEGGQIFCDTLNVFPGNSLAPILTSAGIKPIIANTATFQPGSLIAPENPQDISGKFPLLTATTLNGLENLAFAESAPAKFEWRLISVNNPDATTTLWIRCFKRDAFFMIR